MMRVEQSGGAGEKSNTKRNDRQGRPVVQFQFLCILVTRGQKVLWCNDYVHEMSIFINKKKES